MRSRPTKSVLQIAYDRSDFLNFFEHRLNDGDANTCISYVIAHGVSSEGRGYLLHAEAQPRHPETGYPIRQMLDAFVRGKSKNKLLLLDVVRVDHDLRIGLVGNDFVYDLKREFAALTQKLSRDPILGRQNLRILCSSDDGQKTWSSPELGVSPFALAVSYCLAGGAAADQNNAITHTTDRKISATELMEYVSHSVANWSLQYRNASQTPVQLKYGGDFSLTAVDTNVTIPAILASVAPTKAGLSASIPPAAEVTPPVSDGPHDHHPTAHDKQPEASAQTEQTGITDEAADSTDNVQALLAQIGRHWEQTRTFQLSSQSARRPLLLSRVQKLLTRAEKYLLSGVLEKTRQILDKELPLLVRELQSSVDEPHWTFPWTLASINSTSKNERLLKEQALVEKVLVDPSDANVHALGDLESVEAGMLHGLASYCRSGGKWLDAELMRLAVTTRTLGQPLFQGHHTEVLDFVKQNLETGDHHRLQAERDLVLGRFDSARQGFQAAAIEYQTAVAESELSSMLLAISQQMAMRHSKSHQLPGIGPGEQ